MDVLKSKSFWNSSLIVVAMLFVGGTPYFGDSSETLIAWLGVLAIAQTLGHKSKDILLPLIETYFGGGSVIEMIDVLDKVETDPLSTGELPEVIEKKDN